MEIATNPEEYTKLIGRDNAYIEVSASNLMKLVEVDNPVAEMMTKDPKFVVIRALRIEVSDPQQIQALLGILKRIKGSPEAVGLNSEQQSFLAFRKVFETGLKSLSQE